MITRLRFLLPSAVLLFSAGLFGAALAGCSESRAGTDPANGAQRAPLGDKVAEKRGGGKGSSQAGGQVGELVDAPLPEASRQLLDIAARAAHAIPSDPHIKDRSRAQELVVDTCLALQQPKLALGSILRIDNWRRGTAWADLAHSLALHGDTQDVQHYLDLARDVSEHADEGGDEDGAGQSWRRDRIRAAIARTHLLLGHTELAAEFSAGIDVAEAGVTGTLAAQLSDPATFDECLKELDAAIATSEFDRVHNALEACAALHARFYADESRRTQLVQRIEASTGKLPILVALDVMQELAEAALAHGDQVGAAERVDAMQKIVDGSRWLPEDQVPLMARLAVLRDRNGDGARARADLKAALALYDAELRRIANVFRAGALRPVAEAYQAIGEPSAALAMYARAVEAGVENPNSRPRAEDLSATCCSMAQHGVQPGPELLARLSGIEAALAAPW